MSESSTKVWFHSNRYTRRSSACEHCGDLPSHGALRSTQRFTYAYQIVLDPGKLTAGDALILHALGVTWTGCHKDCSAK